MGSVGLPVYQLSHQADEWALAGECDTRLRICHPCAAVSAWVREFDITVSNMMNWAWIIATIKDWPYSRKAGPPLRRADLGLLLLRA